MSHLTSQDSALKDLVVVPSAKGCHPTAVADRLLYVEGLDSHRYRTVSYENRPPVTKAKTVAFHYWRYGIGGAEKVTYALMDMLRSMGYTVVLYTDEPARDGDYALPPGVQRVVVPTDGKRERVLFWLDEIQRRSIDVMVYNSWLTPWAPADCLAIQSAGAAFVYHTHGVATYFIGSDLDAEYLERMQKLGRLADLVVVLSEADLLFWSVLSSQVMVVTNPVDHYMASYVPTLPSPHGPTVLVCGRLDPVEKKPEAAFSIFARVVKKVPDATLRLVGGGEVAEEQSLRKLAHELDIAGSVVFEGFQTDVAPFMLASDAMLVTSPTEGFALTLAEAACLGLPTVAYELPNLALGQGNQGIVQVPQGDEEQAAQALTAILQDKRLHERMASATKDAYRRVCAINLQEQWSSVIDRAVHSRNTHRTAPLANASASNAFASLVIEGYKREIAKTDRLKSRIEDAEQKAACAQEALGCVTSSISFKIGRAMTAPLRNVRDALAHIRRHL